MKELPVHPIFSGLHVLVVCTAAVGAPVCLVRGASHSADTLHAEDRLIDLHQHINYTDEHLARAVRIMDRVGLGIGVNLSGSTTTQKAGEKSAFERNKGLAVASAVEPHAERTRGRTFSKTNASDRRIVACFGLGAGLA